MYWAKETGGLGFRDLYSFNLAMLAKQGWRLIKDEDSLVARVLKAKHYPRGNFMIAQLGSNPSGTWRSLIEGRTILEKGLIWRVRNGEKKTYQTHGCLIY